MNTKIAVFVAGGVKTAWDNAHIGAIPLPFTSTIAGIKEYKDTGDAGSAAGILLGGPAGALAGGIPVAALAGAAGLYRRPGPAILGNLGTLAGMTAGGYYGGQAASDYLKQSMDQNNVPHLVNATSPFLGPLANAGAAAAEYANSGDVGRAAGVGLGGVGGSIAGAIGGAVPGAIGGALAGSFGSDLAKRHLGLNEEEAMALGANIGAVLGAVPGSSLGAYAGGRLGGWALGS